MCVHKESWVDRVHALFSSRTGETKRKIWRFGGWISEFATRTTHQCVWAGPEIHRRKKHTYRSYKCTQNTELRSKAKPRHKRYHSVCSRDTIQRACEHRARDAGRCAIHPPHCDGVKAQSEHEREREGEREERVTIKCPIFNRSCTDTACSRPRLYEQVLEL